MSCKERSGARSAGRALAGKTATSGEKAPAGSGAISLNGAAARRAQVGDLLIICTYATMSEDVAATYKPKVVLLDERNAIKEIRKF